MKLTNQDREDFCDSVMKSIPWQCQMDKGALVATIEKRMYDALPADAKEFKKARPRLFAITKSSGTVKHPANIRRHSDGYMLGDVGYINYITFECEECEAVQITDAVNEYVKRLDEQLKRDELREELRVSTLTCGTLKTLQERFPALVQHMPKEKTKALAVVGPDTNTLNKLMAAGLEATK